MKKIFALLLAAAMCFSLAACGGGNDVSNNNDASAPVLENNGEQQTTEDNTPNIIEIELTAENFDTYFEYVEVAFFSENAFGEVDEMNLYQYYLVREEYTVSDVSTLAIEYNNTWQRIPCDVDFANQTYVLGDFEHIADPSTEIDDSCSKYKDIDGKERYGFKVGGISRVSKDSGNNIIGYCFDFEILRATGTLFLIEE